MSENDGTAFGDVLRRAIRESGLSQYRLSRDAGVPQGAISVFLSGKDILLNTFEKLALCVGVGLQDLKSDTSDTFTITMFGETIDVVVQSRIDETMSRCKSNKSEIAVIVGVHNVGMEDRERFMECLERILPIEEWRAGFNFEEE